MMQFEELIAEVRYWGSVVTDELIELVSGDDRDFYLNLARISIFSLLEKLDSFPSLTDQSTPNRVRAIVVSARIRRDIEAIKKILDHEDCWSSNDIVSQKLVITSRILNLKEYLGKLEGFTEEFSNSDAVADARRWLESSGKNGPTDDNRRFVGAIIDAGGSLHHLKVESLCGFNWNDPRKAAVSMMRTINKKADTWYLKFDGHGAMTIRPKHK